MQVKLSKEQIQSLVQPLTEKWDTIVEFYKNPDNESQFREWYFLKYGRYPSEV